MERMLPDYQKDVIWAIFTRVNGNSIGFVTIVKEAMVDDIKGHAKQYLGNILVNGRFIRF